MPLDRRTFLAAAAAIPTGGTSGVAPPSRLVAPPPAAAEETLPDDAIDEFVRARMAAKRIPGAALAIVRGEQVMKAKGYGFADLETRRPAEATSVFPMASASKFLTGLLAMDLAEAGLLDLDAPAADYLPSLKAKHADVRIHQMLSHSSGLAPLSDNAAYSEEYARREKAGQFVDARHLEYFIPEELIDAGAHLAPREPPGQVWRYNQYPFFLFGQIVRRLTRLDFEQAVRRSLFDPPGLDATAYGDYRALVPGRRSNNYTAETGELQNLALRYSPSFWPAAGCNSSAADLAALLAALRPGKLLNATSLARLAAPIQARKADGSDAAYGIACTSMATDGRRWFGHEGGGCCYLGWWPDQELGIALLFNLSGTGEDGIERAIASMVLRS